MKIASVRPPSVRFAGCMILLVSGFAATIKANSVSVIPKPVRLEMKEGKFLFKPGMAILADSAVAAEGRFFAHSLAPALGFTPEVSTSRIGSAPHVEMKLVRSLEKLGDEGYRLDVSPKRILLTAPTAAGIFYGSQTLRQLLPVQGSEQRRDSMPFVIMGLSRRYAWGQRQNRLRTVQRLDLTLFVYTAQSRDPADSGTTRRCPAPFRRTAGLWRT
jgi:N-acetyl-beta-hexosaminidase